MKKYILGFLFLAGTLLIGCSQSPVNQYEPNVNDAQPLARTAAGALAPAATQCTTKVFYDSSYIAHKMVDSAYKVIEVKSRDSVYACGGSTTPRNRKIIYIDKLATRLLSANDMTAINLAFTPGVKHGNNQTNFNEAWCYTMSTILSSSTLSKTFGDWVSMRKKADPTFRVGCVNSFDKAITYNKAQTDSTRRIDLLVYEEEYWNTQNPTTKVYDAALALSKFVADSADMVKYKSQIGLNGIKGIEFYGHHFKDGYKSRAPRWFAKWSITLHSYMASPSADYVPYRMDSLDAAKGIDYGMLGSCEAAFWGDEVKSLGWDSCCALQKKKFLSHNYKSLSWSKTICFDWEYYAYYTFTSPAAAARRTFTVATPEFPTRPEHLKEIQ